MKAQIQIQQTGRVFTVSVMGEELGQHYRGSLQGTLKEPLIDALLWYALMCTVETYVITATGRKPMDKATQVGEALVGYLFGGPYCKNGADTHAKACKTVSKYLPHLDQLQNAGPEPDERAETLRNIRDLAATLERISLREDYSKHISPYMELQNAHA